MVSQFPQEIQVILSLECILDKCQMGRQQVLGLKLSSGQFSYYFKISATPQSAYSYFSTLYAGNVHLALNYWFWFLIQEKSNGYPQVTWYWERQLWIFLLLLSPTPKDGNVSSVSCSQISFSALPLAARKANLQASHLSICTWQPWESLRTEDLTAASRPYASISPKAIQMVLLFHIPSSKVSSCRFWVNRNLFRYSHLE